MSEVKLSVPLGGAVMTTVRLTAGGLCSLAGLDLDRSEDCKVCVTEGLLLLSHAGFGRAEILFSVEGGIAVEVNGKEKGSSAAEAPEDLISEALLSALAEDVVMEKNEGVLNRLKFRFTV